MRVALIGAVVGVGAILVAACGAITSFDGFVEEGSDGGAGIVPSSTDGAPSGKDGSSGSSGSTSSGGTDAGTDGPTCRSLGSSCGKSSDCCSNACNQKEDCATSCIPLDGTGCDPARDDTCCRNTFCSAPQGTKCRPCIQKNNQAELFPDGGANRLSCCSRKLNTGTTTCDED